MKPILKSA